MMPIVYMGETLSFNNLTRPNPQNNVLVNNIGRENLRNHLYIGSLLISTG